jgi:hypothetical protein
MGGFREGVEEEAGVVSGIADIRRRRWGEEITKKVDCAAGFGSQTNGT